MIIGILGYGSLGKAIDARLKDRGFEYRLATRRTISSEQNNGTEITRNIDAVRRADIFNICVKQRDLQDLAAETAGYLDGKVGVSFVAGISTADLEKTFGNESRIARAMTSLAFNKGKALTAVNYGKLDSKDKDLLREYLLLGGDVIELKEEKFDAFTVAYACAIGWVDVAKEFFARDEDLKKAMVSASESIGFDKSESEILATRALDGNRIMTDGLERGKFFGKVASAGGMTEAGWKEFNAAIEEGCYADKSLERCYKKAVGQAEVLREKAKRK